MSFSLFEKCVSVSWTCLFG